MWRWDADPRLVARGSLPILPFVKENTVVVGNGENDQRRLCSLPVLLSSCVRAGQEHGMLRRPGGDSFDCEY